MKRTTRHKAVFACVVIGCALLSIAMIWRALAQQRHALEEQALYLTLSESVGDSTGVWFSRPSTCGLSEDDAARYTHVLLEDFVLANGPWSRPARMESLKGRVAFFADWGATRFTAKSGELVLFEPTRHAVWAVSRAGFDHTRTRAMVCVERLDAAALSSLVSTEQPSGAAERRGSTAAPRADPPTIYTLAKRTGRWYIEAVAGKEAD